MCILFIYTNPQPENGNYKLIIASNRDEFYKRPAIPAYYCDKTKIIGGRDMEPGREGGMWLGISIKDGIFRFGALLNVRTNEKTEGHGRGGIVFNYLNNDNNITTDLYINNLKTIPFSNFNFVGVELDDLTIKTNFYSNSPYNRKSFLNEQILGFGNSPFESPLKKVTFGNREFEKIIKSSLMNREELIENLFNLLKNSSQHLPDPELKNRCPQEFESLSSIFVKMQNIGYGTRTHSIILVDNHGNVEFIEHTMKENTDFNKPEWDQRSIKAHL